MAKSLMIPYHLRILFPKFQKIWSKNKVARALPCLAWAPPNLAGWQHSATGFCFWPFAKLFLVWLIWNFGSTIFTCKENCIPIAIRIDENSEYPNIGSAGQRAAKLPAFKVGGLKSQLGSGPIQTSQPGFDFDLAWIILKIWWAALCSPLT